MNKIREQDALSAEKTLQSVQAQGASEEEAAPSQKACKIGTPQENPTPNSWDSMLNTPWYKHCLYLAIISVAAVIISAAYIIFIQANELLAGGVWGMAAIIRYFWDALPFGAILLVLNTPLFIWGWRQLDLRFCVYTLYAAVLQSILLIVLEPYLPGYQENPLLACIFGGTLMGLGSGILVRYYGCAGGMDIVGAVLKKKYDMSIGSVSFSFNIVIISVAALLFGVEKAMYTIVFLFIMATVFNKVLEGFNSKRNVTIISEKGEELAGRLMARLGRGITIMQGVGCYSHEEKDVLICVISRFELAMVKEIIRQVDPQAFASINNVYDVMGAFPRKGKGRRSLI